MQFLVLCSKVGKLVKPINLQVCHWTNGNAKRVLTECIILREKKRNLSRKANSIFFLSLKILSWGLQID